MRPHVARVAGRAGAVLLDFDGMVCDLRAALPPGQAQPALDALLARELRPRPPVLLAESAEGTLSYLARHEPDLFAEAEQLIAVAELDGALTAAPAGGLGPVLDTCEATGRPVAVVSRHSRAAVLAYLQAHGLSARIAAVSARDGADRDGLVLGRSVVARACALLRRPPADCLLVSGTAAHLWRGRRAGVLTMGCLCGRDRRSHLASPDTPVVAGHAGLAAALAGP